MGERCLGSRISPQAVAIVQCIGYGCYHTFFCGGALGVAHTANALAGSGVLLSQLVLLAATALGCLGYRYLLRKVPALSSRLLGAVSLATVAVVFVLEFISLPGANTPSICLLSCIAGLAMSYPLLFWFDQFLGVYQRKGRVRCIVAIALGTASCTIVSLAAPLAGGGASTAFALVMAALVLSGICQLLLAEREESRPIRPATRERYRLTTYSAATLVGFGTTWGLSVAVSLHPYEPDVPWTSPVLPALAAVGACAVIAVSTFCTRGREGLRFGLLIRLSIASAGIVFGLSPLLYEFLPGVLYPLCRAVGIFLGIAMTFFSVEICHESGLRIPTVMPVNYVLFVLTACISAGVFWAFQTFVGGHLAWDLTGALAIVATMGAVPLLPSLGSDATAFAQKELPETEGYEAHTAKLRESLAAKYRLTPRESEVLNLLLAGKTRQEIADELSLSSWTVKEHIGNIYSKMEIHSYKELMTLAAGGTNR